MPSSVKDMLAAANGSVPAISPQAAKALIESGEAGCAGSLACIVNAVIDALSEYGVAAIDMPLTPERVWRAIRDAKTKAA